MTKTSSERSPEQSSGVRLLMSREALEACSHKQNRAGGYNKDEQIDPRSQRHVASFAQRQTLEQHIRSHVSPPTTSAMNMIILVHPALAQRAGSTVDWAHMHFQCAGARNSPCVVLHPASMYIGAGW